MHEESAVDKTFDEVSTLGGRQVGKKPVMGEGGEGGGRNVCIQKIIRNDFQYRTGRERGREGEKGERKDKKPSF